MAITLLAAKAAAAASPPVHQVPPPAADTIAAAIDAEPRRGPFRFAHELPLSAGLDDGAWDEPLPGTARWQLHLRAEAAHSISLALAHFAGPATAQLFLRGAHSDVTQGPYRPQQANGDGRMWTALVPDEEAVLELLVPAEARAQVALQLDALYYGFRSPLGAQQKNLTLGKSGRCNIDVACLQGTEYDRVARSVALVTSGAIACTGNLVNSTANDNDLLLTAHHCEQAFGNLSSLAVYWNVQAATCNGDPVDPDFSQSQVGAALLASHERSDHALLRLNAVPDAAFDVFYSGWDARTGETPASSCGTSIHHPMGGIKKASVFNSTPQITTSAIQGQTSHVWEVTWAYGTTEGGSSGAGLWNAQQRLIGVLFGGEASCSAPTRPDVYGRLNVGWDAFDDPANALKAHLDPVGNGTGRVLNGREAGASLPTAPAALDCPIPAPEGIGSSSSSGGSTWLPLLAVLLLLRRRRAAH